MSEKQKALIEALDLIYKVSTQAPFPKNVHDKCEQAVKQLIEYIYLQENSKKEELKQVK